MQVLSRAVLLPGTGVQCRDCLVVTSPGAWAAREQRRGCPGRPHVASAEVENPLPNGGDLGTYLQLLQDVVLSDSRGFIFLLICWIFGVMSSVGTELSFFFFRHPSRAYGSTNCEHEYVLPTLGRVPHLWGAPILPRAVFLGCRQARSVLQSAGQPARGQSRRPPSWCPGSG